mmetsp:Transcript_3819/g.10025  ORF Transcript_3819/g.10025 Transcript_3819/m.10025 type:complete len:194 (+) Transcript_3819:608-1189(+)
MNNIATTRAIRMTASIAATPPASTRLWPIKGKHIPVKMATKYARNGSATVSLFPKQGNPRKDLHLRYFQERDPRFAKSTKHVRKIPPNVQTFWKFSSVVADEIINMRMSSLRSQSVPTTLEVSAYAEIDGYPRTRRATLVHEKLISSVKTRPKITTRVTCRNLSIVSSSKAQPKKRVKNISSAAAWTTENESK